MINEKELRVGNLYATTRSHEILVKGIDTINKFITVDPIYIDPDIADRGENSLIFEDLHAVELTEAKLLQLGFTKEDTISINIASDKGAKLKWDEKKGQIVLEDCEEGVIGQSVKYVHQFQNIYYFLTGKELPLITTTA